jgi:hypothetical protein
MTDTSPVEDDLAARLIKAAEGRNWPGMAAVILDAVGKDELVGLCEGLIKHRDEPTTTASPEDDARREYVALLYALGVLRGDPWTQGEAYLRAARVGRGDSFVMALRAMGLVHESLPDEARGELTGRLQHQLDALVARFGGPLTADDADKESDYLDEPLRRLLGDGKGGADGD